ncbi:MAG: tetratricopeptide repeat protein [Chitinophagales bacterium]|nr:tetratricopeptide repeat protein [Chitinophagales bacterium]
MRKVLQFGLLLVVLLGSSSLFAQKGRDETLAKSYFENAEYDKAAYLYVQLWENNNQAQQFYAPLLKCYLQQKKWDDAEKLVRKQSKKFSENFLYQIDLGAVLRLKGDEGAAQKQFEKVIKELRPNENELRQTAGYFGEVGELDFEIATFNKAQKMFGGKIDFSTDLASTYLQKNDYKTAAAYYLEYIDRHPYDAQPVKNTIQTARGGDKLMSEMETQLYTKIQKQPDKEDYIELLTWIYIQNKDFEGALLQMKAIDKRKSGDGYRVLEIAHIAQTEGFYDDAISGYEYVVAKEPRTSLYFQARTDVLNCRKEKIAKKINYTDADLQALKADYESFIAENGKNARTAQSIKELADLYGFYIHDINAAVATSEELIDLPGIPQSLKNQAKLSLGDFYLISGDVWESSLVYSQVDKEEKDSPLGEEARFKNAKLSYYKGEFEWAQEQLNILKASTSQLISNDAINLSVFIIDNLGMDTISVPMELFSQADLLMFQNKDGEADKVLDSIVFTYPGHELFDDIEYAKAQIYCRKRQFEKAIPLLENIVKNYGKDLKGDDALFLLADITEREMNNKEKAKELFKQLIVDYQSSLLVVEARKRYRVLRGDKLE